MHFVNVTCTSTARPNFTIPGTAIANGAKFQTSLAFPNETLTCTFNWALNP
jgi:hypothetical protein